MSTVMDAPPSTGAPSSGGMGSVGSPTMAPLSSPGPGPAAMPPPQIPGGLPSGLQPAVQPQGQPVVNPALPPALQPGVQTPAVPAAPDYGWLEQRGGEVGVKPALAMFDSFKGARQNPTQFLDTLYGHSEELYNVVLDQFINDHPEIAINRILSNPQYQAQLYKELGFSKEDYDGYAQYLAQKAQTAGANTQEGQQIRALQQELARMQQEQQQGVSAQQAQVAQQRQQEFTSKRYEPLGKIMSELNFPNDEKGQIQSMLLSGGVQAMFRSNPQLMGMWEEAMGMYQRGEETLAAGTIMSINRSIENIARKAQEHFTEHNRLQKENQDLRARLGMAVTEGGQGVTGAPASAPPPAAAPLPPGVSRLSFEGLKPQLDAAMAAQRARRQ